MSFVPEGDLRGPRPSAELRAELEAIAEPAILLSRDYRILAANGAYAAH
ncbi:MAG: hypothetical protein AAGH15_16565 [Myxococcota bacterium]